MPVGYPKSGRKHRWNGAGMAILSKERRAEIGEAQSVIYHEKNKGWPECFQGRKYDRETLERCTLEWERLMMASACSQ